MNKPPHGNDFRKLNSHFEMLKGKAQNDPNMTIFINAGTAWINGKMVEYVGGNSPEFTKPSAGAK